MDGSVLRKSAFAMPPSSPAFPPGPYQFVDRQYLIIRFGSYAGSFGASTGCFRSRSAHRSAMAMIAALTGPVVMLGITEASQR